MGDDVRAGRVLAERYTLVERIGAGGFGAVWRALDRVTAQEVAVKILHPPAGASALSYQKQRSRFMAEGAILERLDHPQIVRPIARFVDGEDACLVTELIRGVTLREVVVQRARADLELSLGEVLAVVGPLAAALDHAHARGVVHRDLKPQNVMLIETGGRLDLRVLDFGVARLVRSEEADATTVGRVLGTLLYMAPEQFRTPQVGAPADQFALATLLFELITLRWAWARDARGQPMSVEASLRASDGNAYASLLQRICMGQRPRIRDVRPDLPEELDVALARAWASDEALRYPSAGAFAAAVRDALLPIVEDHTQVDVSRTALTLLKGGELVSLMPSPIVMPSLVRGSVLDTPSVMASLPEAPVIPAAVSPRRGLAILGAVAVLTVAVGFPILRSVRGERPAAEPPAPAPAVVPRIGPRVVEASGGVGTATASRAASAPSAPSVGVGAVVRAPVDAGAGSTPSARDAGAQASATRLRAAGARATPIGSAGKTERAEETEPIDGADEADVDVAGTGSPRPVSAETARARATVAALTAQYSAERFQALIVQLEGHPEVMASPELRGRVRRASYATREDALPMLRTLVDELR